MVSLFGGGGGLPELGLGFGGPPEVAWRLRGLPKLVWMRWTSSDRSPSKKEELSVLGIGVIVGVGYIGGGDCRCWMCPLALGMGLWCPSASGIGLWGSISAGH
ncbi:unnamed protein product [Ilex paraguariensis]|uniref:Uncharacterized protein n=1 Tax=Ilex paraguariensis TaxID=185542 RepID=A0ABC8SH67_9AQUA